MILLKNILALNESIQLDKNTTMAFIRSSSLALDLKKILEKEITKSFTFDTIKSFLNNKDLKKLQSLLIILTIDVLDSCDLRQFLKSISKSSISNVNIFIFIDKHINIQGVFKFIKRARLLNYNVSLLSDSQETYVLLLRKVGFNQNKALNTYFSKMSEHIYGKKL